MLLLRSHWIEFESGGRRSLGDCVSPLWLSPEQDYRMRQPWAGQTSVVLALNHEVPGWPQHASAIAAASLMRLARLAAAIERDGGDVLALGELVAALPVQACGVATQLMTPMTRRSLRAVNNAREFVAADLATTPTQSVTRSSCFTRFVLFCKRLTIPVRQSAP